MAVIGYIRGSSNKQTLEHQRYEIEQFALQNNIVVDRWVMEKISSRKALNKRQLGQIQDDTRTDCRERWPDYHRYNTAHTCLFAIDEYPILWLCVLHPALPKTPLDFYH